MSTAPRVAVVGAGVAGLATARTLIQDGFEVIGFEQDRSVGGVWYRSNYTGLKTNSPFPHLAFTNFPITPPTREDLRFTGDEVLAYLRAYAEYHGLDKVFQLNKTVKKISKLDKSWRIEVVDRLTGTESSFDFEFVVVCTGVTSEPRIPNFEGSDAFKASGRRILHSSDVKDEKTIADQKVPVIGAGKSAMDMISTAAKVNPAGEKTPTIVARRTYLHVPRNVLGGKVPYEKIFFSRLTNYTIPWHSPFNWFHWMITNTTFGRFLLSLHHANLEKDVRTIQKVRKEDKNPLYSDLPFPTYAGYAGLVTDTLHEALEGKFHCKVGTSVKKLDSEGNVFFADGISDKFDVLICGTGYKHSFPFFSTEDCKRLGIPSRHPKSWDEVKSADEGNFEEQFRLFNTILPVEDHTIAFIGFNLNFDSFLSSEVASHWVSDVFAKRVSLPSKEAMNNRIDKYLSIQAEVVKPNGWTGILVLIAVINFVWDLLHDMELKYPRKPTFFEEHFGELCSQDFNTIHEERKARDEHKKKGRVYKGPYGDTYKSFLWYALPVFVFLIALGVAVMRFF